MNSQSSLITVSQPCVATKKTPQKLNGLTIAQRARLTAANELRAEWQQMFDANEKMSAGLPAGDGQAKYFDAIRNRLRTLLSALDAPKPAGAVYSMKLASVGNVDFGQHHGEGIASPSFVVEAGSLETLVKIYEAYFGVYDLGSGNVAARVGDVWRDNVLVAHISFNGRVWTSEKFPNCKEIDPATGAVKTKSE